MFRPMRQGFRSPPPVGPSPGPFPGVGQAGGGGTFPWGLPGNAGTPPYGVRHRAFTKSPQQQQQQQQQPGPGLAPFHQQQHRYKSPSPGHHHHQQQQSFTPRHSPRHRGRYSSPPYHPLSPGQAASQQPSPGSGHRRYPGSPRTSTPFGGGGGGGCLLERKSPAPVELYYKPSMLQDPWADLEPVSASDISRQYSNPQAASSTKRGRYFS
ncbi:M-phase-specific PLK1-interacting protein [Pristis pectinata]|uniref:M-phase-specific PLK1-interacting protein n=1 Tax=Pristis pectinata TaxID=685728 RepID=UPI00223E414C|nr:M-phase-specific PLK1-interacting protein [Pristis pectinata]